MRQIPIYIPSKGRAGTAKTPKLLQESGIPFTVAVEPQEADDYAKHYGEKNILVLQASGRGLPFSRCSIKRHALAAGAKWHWQLDDDITGFRRRLPPQNGKFKAVKATASEALHGMESFVLQFRNVAAACPKSTASVFNETRAWLANQLIYTCALLRTDVDAWWRMVPEDTDYSLQLLSKGYVTILSFEWLHTSVPPGKAAGGLTEMWKTANAQGMSKREAAMHHLSRVWPGLITVVRKNKYGHASGVPRYSHFKQKPILLDGTVVEPPSR